MVERRAIDNALGIERRDVGVGAYLQPTLRLDSQSLSRHQAHLTKRVHQSERVLFANIAAQHPRVSTRGARMTFARPAVVAESG